MNKLSPQVLLFFCLLLSVHIFMALSFELALREQAVFLLSWTGLSGYVYLWLMNRYKRLLKKQAEGGCIVGEDHLPSQLIYSMHSRQTYDSGVRALKTLDGPFVFMASVFLMYVFYGLFLSAVSDSKLEPLRLIDVHIEEFFSRFGPVQGFRPNIQYFYFQGCLLKTVNLLTAGILFWLTRVLSVGSKLARFLPWYIVVLFLLVFMVLLPGFDWHWPRNFFDVPLFGYGRGSADVYSVMGMIGQNALSQFEIRLFEVGLAGSFIFYAFVSLILISLIRNLFRKSFPVAYTVCALVIISALGILDIFTLYSDKHFSFYLLGIIAISGLGVQSHMNVRKRHTLYH